jgi:hypothetical protein
MKRRLLTLSIAIAAVAALAAPATGDGGAATQGVNILGGGVLSPNGQTRYVAIPDADRTLVAQVLVRNGAILRTLAVPGHYGIPFVTDDGTVGGLSFDGRVLVLASWGQASSLAVVDVKRWRFGKTIRLPGRFSFDALSPKGRVLYLIQHVSLKDYTRYRVRAYDIAYDRLLGRAIVDRRSAVEQMAGSPVTRATGPGGTWAYTLYQRPNGASFIHALDTRHARALCIDLPRKQTQSWIYRSFMRVSRDGAKLDLRVYGTKRLAAVVDTRTYDVTILRRV